MLSRAARRMSPAPVRRLFGSVAGVAAHESHAARAQAHLWRGEPVAQELESKLVATAAGAPFSEQLPDQPSAPRSSDPGGLEQFANVRNMRITSRSAANSGPAEMEASSEHRGGLPLAVASTDAGSSASPAGGGQSPSSRSPPTASSFTSLSPADDTRPEPVYVDLTLTGYVVAQIGDFKLDNGAVLPDVQVAYEMYGSLNARKDNVILLHCGMSASSHAKAHPQNTSPGWWEAFIGPGRALDTTLFCVICTNSLGSCYGTTGPGSPYSPRFALLNGLDAEEAATIVDSATAAAANGAPARPRARYGSLFPRLTVADIVRAQFKVLDQLGVRAVHACVGSSMGGMQSLCAARLFPHLVRKVVSISACAESAPSSIAFRHAQRRAIQSDPAWRRGDYYGYPQQPHAGLKLAREIGTITYRSGREWQQRFPKKDEVTPGSEVSTSHDDDNFNTLPSFQIENYLNHQGTKWINAFDANSMIWLSKAMDDFTLADYDRSPAAGGSPAAPGAVTPGGDSYSAHDAHGVTPELVRGLIAIKQPALVIGVQYDILFPVWQQRNVASALRAAGNERVTYYELDSIYGHDTFLLDYNSVGPAVKGHLEQEPFGAQSLWRHATGAASRAVASLIERDRSTRVVRELFRASAARDLAEGNVATPRVACVMNVIHVVELVWGSEWDGETTRHLQLELDVDGSGFVDEARFVEVMAGMLWTAYDAGLP